MVRTSTATGVVLTAVLAATNVHAAKRGLAWPSDNPFNPSIFKSSKIDWLYNWARSPPALLNNQFPFYVMQWNGADIASLGTAVTAAKSSFVLAFNEPDNSGQSNITPAQAATLWKQYIQPLAAKGIKLISPAITNGGSPAGVAWMDSFITACTGCTFDGIAIHWYGGWIDDFSAFVNSTKKYNKPLYLTEFGLSWDAQAANYEEFLPLALKYLDNEPAITKYAFFGAFHSGGGWDMINANGTLTNLGKIYVS